MAKRRGELKVYGIRAVEGVWRERRGAIRKVYLTRQESKRFRELLQWCASRRIGYELVDTEALGAISGSLHHEGICAVVQVPRLLSLGDVLESGATGLVFLDGVSNPQNVGAILRVAAHFGISHVLGGPKLPGLSGALCRVAEGAAESTALVSLAQPQKALDRLKQAGFALLGTSSHRGNSLYEFRFPRRWCLVLGAEATGVSTDLPGARWLRIPGSGKVESLNVSTACATILGEAFRQSLTHRNTTR